MGAIGRRIAICPNRYIALSTAQTTHKAIPLLDMTKRASAGGALDLRAGDRDGARALFPLLHLCLLDALVDLAKRENAGSYSRKR